MVLVPPTTELAVTWRSQALLGCKWIPVDNQAGVLGGAVPHGEAGGLFVTTDRWPNRRGYLKPRKRDTDPRCARAAREKICADLAYEVGCNVPPVVLTRRAAPAGEEQNCSVSLVLYPRQFSWEQMKAVLRSGPPGTELVRKRLPRAAAIGIAFDTWVGQTDHNEHPHNIVFGFVPSGTATVTEGDFAFLDFAMALGWGGMWDGQPASLGKVPFPPAMTAAIDSTILSGILDRIESVSDDTIRSIVQRVPDDFLVAEQRDLIEMQLIARRSQVREWVGSPAG